MPDFALLQTTASVNFRTGFIGRFVRSGLEYQIEHHLFPNLSHIYYPSSPHWSVGFVPKTICRIAATHGTLCWRNASACCNARLRCSIRKRFDSTRWLFREYSKPVSLPKAVAAKSDLLMAFNRRGQRLPFTGRYMEVIARKQNTDPPPPSQLVSSVPGDLEDLCLPARTPEQSWDGGVPGQPFRAAINFTHGQKFLLTTEIRTCYSGDVIASSRFEIRIWLIDRAGF